MKNIAKYAWSFSGNSSFLRGLFYYAAPCRWWTLLFIACFTVLSEVCGFPKCVYDSSISDPQSVSTCLIFLHHKCEQTRKKFLQSRVCRESVRNRRSASRTALITYTLCLWAIKNVAINYSNYYQ